jgi:hypothetical protein
VQRKWLTRVPVSDRRSRSIEHELAPHNSLFDLALNRMETLACKLTRRDSPTSVRLTYHDDLLMDLPAAELIRD